MFKTILFACLILVSMVGTASAQWLCPFGICPAPRATYNFQYNYAGSSPYVFSPGYRSPPGYHRHRTFSGAIIEHSDYNYGSAYAHRDVPWPAWKYRGPLPPSGLYQLYGNR